MEAHVLNLRHRPIPERRQPPPNSHHRSIPIVLVGIFNAICDNHRRAQLRLSLTNIKYVHHHTMNRLLPDNLQRRVYQLYLGSPDDPAHSLPNSAILTGKLSLTTSSTTPARSQSENEYGLLPPRGQLYLPGPVDELHCDVLAEVNWFVLHLSHIKP